MWYSKTWFVSALTLLVGVILETEGTIRVVSLMDDETVYIIQGRPILTNIDSPSKGILVVAKPANACKPVNPAPPMPINMTLRAPDRNLSSISDDDNNFSWVLLVSWNTMEECSISTKADNALAGGYSVIIFEDPAALVDLEPEALSPLLTPVVTSPAYEYGWTDASVYAYTVDPDDWKILKNNFTSDEYFLTFDDPTSMTSWFTYFLLGILIIGAVFFTIGLSYVLVQLTGLILLWIRESIVSRVQQIRRERRRRLPASQLRKIPIQQWNSDMLQDTCSICLESFEVTDRVRILPCSHVFHQVCIDPWLLKQRRKCPNCKRKIVFPDENRDSGSSSDDERTPLIRRSSSGRESATTSPQNFRYHHGHFLPQSQFSSEVLQPRRDEEYYTAADLLRIMANAENPDAINDIACRPDQHTHCCSVHSSINTSIEAPSENGNDSTAALQNSTDQPDLKGKADQLCARMENMGKKIRKKAKANQTSKLDNDSSSDMSTGIHPVLVSVTVEPNHVPDSDFDKECQCKCDCEGESQSEDRLPCSSNTINYRSSSQNQASSSSQLSPELEVKVVPESFNPSLNNASTGNTESINNSVGRDSSILPPDLNA